MPKVILIGIPNHNNLGDAMIALAEEKIIKEKFPTYELIEFTEEDIIDCKTVDDVKAIIKNVNIDDIIALHGGGNLGNQYLYIERPRRLVCKAFCNNVIIFFPETMYFKDSEDGKAELDKSKQAYNTCKDIYFMAREEISYEKMKKEFKTQNIFLTPDIVTILDKSKDQKEREGTLFVKRNDVENNVSDNFIKQLEGICKKHYSTIQYTDTDIASKERMNNEERKIKLNDMLELYKEKELVITDRLHGMIFAAITGTPCVAIGNYNYKVEASAKWFEKLGYVKFIKKEESLDNIEQTIKGLKSMKNCRYDNKEAIDIFNEVFNKIRNKVDEKIKN